MYAGGPEARAGCFVGAGFLTISDHDIGRFFAGDNFADGELAGGEGIVAVHVRLWTL